MPARSRAARLAGDGFSGDSEGYDGDGFPQGLLEWGQAGIYNGLDDRRVITALSDSVTGIVKPVTLTAGTGLTINVSAGWLGLASCDDGTTAVIGASQSFQLAGDQGVMAGPASGNARRDILWCDTFPNDGRWRMQVIRESETLGRPGLPLAMITCPAGANLASQFTFSRMVPTFGAHAEVSFLQSRTSDNTRVTPEFPIAPWMIRGRSHFRLTAYGWGTWAGNVRSVGFRVGQANSPMLWLNTAGAGFRTGGFSWKAQAAIQVRMQRQNIMISVEGMVRGSHGPSGDFLPNAISGVQQNNLTSWSPDTWQNMHLQARFGASQSGQVLECVSCTYETIEPFDYP